MFHREVFRIRFAIDGLHAPLKVPDLPLTCTHVALPEARKQSQSRIRQVRIQHISYLLHVRHAVEDWKYSAAFGAFELSHKHVDIHENMV